MTKKYDKPLPTIDDESKGFWEGCKLHELRMQICRDCGFYCFPPFPMCPRCNSMDRKWERVSGQGKIYSWYVVHHATHPDFVNDVPYMVVVVTLAEQEDLHLAGNMVDCKPENIWVGMPVEVVFEDVTQDVAFPRWKICRRNVRVGSDAMVNAWLTMTRIY